VILNPEREASPNSNSSRVERALLAEEPAHSEEALIDVFGEPQFDTQDSCIAAAGSRQQAFGKRVAPRP